MNDSELLSAYLRDGSEEAFTGLVNRHMKLVFSAALRQVGGDAHLAKDVVQNVFSALARKAGTLRNHKALSGWLYTCTHFASADAVRAEKRRQASERAAHLLNESSSSETPEVWDRIRPVLDQAMNELSARDRQALLLRYFEDRPFADVGEKLSLSENAARMRVARALDKMHALLAKHGVTSSTAALAAILLEQSASAAVPAELVAEISGTALAGASAAGALSLASFMAAAKMGVGLVSLLMIGFGLNEYRDMRTTDAALIVARQEYNAEKTHLQELEARLIFNEQTRAALKKTADAQPAAPARDPRADGQAFLAAFPEQRAALLDVGKAQIARKFGPFYRAASLSSAQIDQFESFVVEVWAQNITATPGSIHPDIIQFPEEQLHALLGDQAYQHYQAYNRAEGAYAFARQLATAATNTNAPPLSANQADQLAQIILSHSPTYQVGQSFSAAAMDWDAVMLQSQEVLSAPQLKAMEAWLLNLQYRVALAQAERAPNTSVAPAPSSKAQAP